jgi:hypothetical protein
LESFELYYTPIFSLVTDVFLIVEHCGAEYIGALLLNDPVFCQEIFEVLLVHIGKTIQEIGDIDLSYTP